MVKHLYCLGAVFYFAFWFKPQLGMRMRLIWVSIQGGNAMGAGWVACCRQLGRVAESGAPRPTAGAATFAPHQDHLPPPPRPI